MSTEVKKPLLMNGAQLAAENPVTFQRPSAEELAALDVGDLVKVIFVANHEGSFGGERMWVEVEQINEDRSLVGVLRNYPVLLEGLHRWGDRLIIVEDNIIDIKKDKDEAPPGLGMTTLPLSHGLRRKNRR